ncbi:unnamed protein product [Protopolystoma xenopodis]|uniref:ETS domain-containing protein n=1 Tax=Protopolystoma xenopodis TaxID=117903 RepID=A0A448WCN1_9PLAT|nr:unnamed protein product [Protopolystoma xenopodis]
MLPITSILATSPEARSRRSSCLPCCESSPLGTCDINALSSPTARQRADSTCPPRRQPEQTLFFGPPSHGSMSKADPQPVCRPGDPTASGVDNYAPSRHASPSNRKPDQRHGITVDRLVGRHGSSRGSQRKLPRGRLLGPIRTRFVKCSNPASLTTSTTAIPALLGADAEAVARKTVVGGRVSRSAVSPANDVSQSHPLAVLFGRRRALQLWQFLVDLLDEPGNQHLIVWTEREAMEFKLNEPELVCSRPSQATD